MRPKLMRYFITFACYGARLHGAEAGSVDSWHNLPEAYLASNPTRCASPLSEIAWANRPSSWTRKAVPLCSKPYTRYALGATGLCLRRTCEPITFTQLSSPAFYLRRS